MLKTYIREVLAEMSTRYKRETGANLPRWKERLMQYADSGEHFVHFSHFPKLGLNPLNKYDTPTGFYTYPLERGKISNFATDRPYIVVVAVNDDSGPILHLSDYSEDDLQRDIEVLQDEFGLTQEMEDEGREGARVQTPGGILWNITRLLSVSRGEEKKTERNPAWTRKKGSHYKDLMTVAKMLDGKTGRERQAEIEQFRANFQNSAISKADHRKWKRIYNLARNLPASITPEKIEYQEKTQKEFLSNPRVSDWSRIFRRLGYEGVIDDGESIIHTSEPFQGVFFSAQGLNLVDIIRKQGRDESLEDDESWTDMGELGVKDTPKEHTGGSPGEYESAHFKGSLVDQIGGEPAGINFFDCNFQEVDASSISFEGSRIGSCTVKDTDFTSSHFTNAYISHSKFERVDFSGSNMSDSYLQKITFTGCSFDSANIGTATIKDCTFIDCNFQETDFEGAKFISTLIKDTSGDLVSINLSGATLQGLKVLPSDTDMPPGYMIPDETGQVVKA